jgi:hypothetical protein
MNRTKTTQCCPAAMQSQPHSTWRASSINSTHLQPGGGPQMSAENAEKKDVAPSLAKGPRHAQSHLGQNVSPDKPVGHDRLSRHSARLEIGQGWLETPAATLRDGSGVVGDFANLSDQPSYPGHSITSAFGCLVGRRGEAPPLSRSFQCRFDRDSVCVRRECQAEWCK